MHLFVHFTIFKCLQINQILKIGHSKKKCKRESRLIEDGEVDRDQNAGWGQGCFAPGQEESEGLCWWGYRD